MQVLTQEMLGMDLLDMILGCRIQLEDMLSLVWWQQQGASSCLKRNQNQHDSTIYKTILLHDFFCKDSLMFRAFLNLVTGFQLLACMITWGMNVLVLVKIVHDWVLTMPCSSKFPRFWYHRGKHTRGFCRLSRNGWTNSCKARNGCWIWHNCCGLLCFYRWY